MSVFIYVYFDVKFHCIIILFYFIVCLLSLNVTHSCLKTEAYKAEVHSEFGKLLRDLNKSDAPYALSVANRLYGEQSYQFVEVCKHYNAELESVDFSGNSEAARVNINSWVEERTQGKIKDVLAKGVVDSLTRLVLVNAIYFKGNWNKLFKEIATHDVQFKITKVTLQQNRHRYIK
uniref:Serpin domain-containing protein n=1 Tax=Stegastes partitus TaxID=144197 RepID=A0A3B4ZRD1_9TELE